MNAEDMAAGLRAMASVMRRAVQLPAELHAALESIRKASRPRLTYAKRCAWALRHNLRLAADFHRCAPKSAVDKWIEDYLTACKHLRVTPPIVKVPRSLRRYYGVMIGGKPTGWGAEPQAFDWAAYLPAAGEP